MTGKKRQKKTFLMLALISLSLVFVFPLFWMFVTALKRPEDLAAYPVSIMPPVSQWQHFREVLLTNDVLEFWKGLRNSLTFSVTVTVLVTLSSALAGFGFARYRARGKNFFFSILLATMMIPQLLFMIPQYILFSQLRVIGHPYPFSFLPMWLPALPGWAFFIFLFRQFFATLPKELEDAAMIDGCSRLRTFWRIFMPMAGPAVATTCILAFQWTYSDFAGPLFYLTMETQTLSVLMVHNVHVPGVNWLVPYPPIPYQMTVGVFYTLPLLILFLVAQRYFMQSIAMSGLKS